MSALTERMARALRALLSGPVMREDVDRIAGASNGPAVIRQLRRQGLEIRCEVVKRIDRDGKACRPGRYSIADDDRATALALLG